MKVQQIRHKEALFNYASVIPWSYRSPSISNPCNLASSRRQILKNLCQQNKLDTEIRCKIVRPCGICSFYSQSQRDINEVVSQISTIHDDLCDACSLIEVCCCSCESLKKIFSTLTFQFHHIKKEYFSAQMLTTVAIAFLIIVFNT